MATRSIVTVTSCATGSAPAHMPWPIAKSVRISVAWPVMRAVLPFTASVKGRVTGRLTPCSASVPVAT